MCSKTPEATRGALHFLVRDALYDQEKPYTIQYEPHGEIPRTNIKGISVPDVNIRDLRPTLSGLSFDRDGVVVKSLETELQYEDFGDPQKVQKVYLEEVRVLLQETLGSHNVAVVEYLVRRRHQQFPATTDTEFDFAQPVATAHIDFSPDCLKEILQDRYGDERAAKLMQLRYKMVNIWKPLFGPLQDWPLALCHPASLDIEEDLELTDNVYPLNVDESVQIHYNENQDWCYLSKQSIDEVLIFRGGDSALGLRGGTFLDPLSVSGPSPSYRLWLCTRI
ncbi:MAG: hypothetical protein Q9170_002077 [Blastenia crenularia]